MTTIESVTTSHVFSCHFSPCKAITLNLNVFFREVPDELFAKMKAIVNDADNVTIAPRSVVEDVSSRIIFYLFLLLLNFFTLCQKREAIEKSLRGDAGEAEDEEGEEGEEGEDEEEEEEEEVPQGNISDDESDHTADEHK